MQFVEVKTDTCSFSMPSGWEVKRPELNKTVLLGPNVGPLKAGFIIVELKDRGDEFVKIIAEARRQQLQLPMFEVINETDLSKQGFEAWRVRTRWYDENADLMIDGQNIFSRYGNDVFVLTSSIPNTPAKAELDQVFTQIIESFRLH